MSRALGYCQNMHYICCKILGINPIKVVGYDCGYEGYRGSHNLSQSILEVNQRLLDESDAFDHKTNYSDLMVSLWILSGIVAHETMHLYQENNPTPQRISEQLYEAKHCQDFTNIDAKVYYNLSIELEANAFAAFIEEKTLMSSVGEKEHYPINPDTNTTKFNAELARMYRLYDSIYDKVMQQLNNSSPLSNED